MTYIGLATRFTNSTHTIANYQAVKNKMLQYGLNVIRLGSGDELFGSSYTWHNGDAVQWFLDNTDVAVIVDRHHTINNTFMTQAQWNTIDANLDAMAVRWVAYGDRVLLEPVNEYAGTDFQSQMQRIINTFRGNGRTTWLIFNTFPPWTRAILTDSLRKTYAGDHYYMNLATATNDYGLTCFNRMVDGHGITGLPMFGSEEGADYNETPAFTKEKVDALSRYLQLCADAGYSNVVWMLSELKNMPTYESLGIVFPTVPSTQKKYVFKQWQDGDTNPTKTVII